MQPLSVVVGKRSIGGGANVTVAVHFPLQRAKTFLLFDHKTSNAPFKTSRNKLARKMPERTIQSVSVGGSTKLRA